MQPLLIDPPMPYLLPHGAAHIVLVGCGGTGSHIAQALARLAVHRGVALSFVDGDTVEKKNVGRQLFSQADVGQNKAQVLAARFGLVFGLTITAVPEMATFALLRTITSGDPRIVIVIGAVDNNNARTEINQALPHYHLWIDAGNHEAAGQVVVGSVSTATRLRSACALGGICTALPAPGLVYPDLLRARKRSRERDCAAAMVADEQSLMINQFMAAIVAQYVYQIVVDRRLTTFETVIDLQSLTMRSTSITVSNISRSAGVSADLLTTGTQGVHRRAV